MFSFSGLLADKPNSVVDKHLSGILITQGLGRHSLPKKGTALHAGKDLFVAPSSFNEILPQNEYREGASGFRLWRHCGHLYPCGRRALPATSLPVLPPAHVRTFLPAKRRSACPAKGPCVLYHTS